MNELLLNAVDPLHQWLLGLGDIGALIWIILKILVITVPVIISVAFYVVWERKLIGWMHVRHGPMYVGMGIFQAFADVFKLLFKEVVQPSSANKAIYLLAPLITLAPAFAAWSVVPFDSQIVLSNANAGLLYLLAMTSLGIYGIILAGWASNSKYAFLGAMRASAQMISYEIAMGFALVGVMIAAGSLNLSNIVMAQAGNSGFFDWFLLPLFPLFVIYWVSGVAETNRAPFDMPEAEQELTGGFHTEYSGMRWALFFLVMGCLNLYVAYNFDTDVWVNFKLFGSMGLMVVFILAQSVWLARHMQERPANAANAANDANIGDDR